MSLGQIARDTVRVRRALLAVYVEDAHELWLRAPNPMLNGLPPNELICRGETERVLDVIDQLASGAVL